MSDRSERESKAAERIVVTGDDLEVLSKDGSDK
jgi:hypothetical protein